MTFHYEKRKCLINSTQIKAHLTLSGGRSPGYLKDLPEFFFKKELRIYSNGQTNHKSRPRNDKLVFGNKVESSKLKRSVFLAKRIHRQTHKVNTQTDKS